MQRLTNIFSALSFVEDDEDLTPDANPKSKGSNGNNGSSSVKDGDGGEKRDSNGPHELYKPLVWIDLEMTGLDLETDLILEIACIITDGRLEKMIEGPDLIIQQPEGALARMNDWCQEHHTASGLVDGVRRSIISQAEAEKQVLDFVTQHVAPGRALLAGNSVYVDLLFLRKYMPKLAEFFPHVLVDVSSLRALCVRWYPRDADKAPQKKKKHRALDDIKESIAELRYMQGAIFKRPKR
ncbi:unnamed protein product [Calypogeia fissa]